MQANISYRFTSVGGSEADGDDANISGEWLMFAAIALLTTVLVLCAASATIDPGLLWPEPSLIGP
jgi:hypothetical protein